MKKNIPLTLFILIGCIVIILIVLYFTQPIKSSGADNFISPTSIPSINATPPSGIAGKLEVSIGDYIAKLPVFIDNTSVGFVSQGKPLKLNVSEGHHTVRVCAGDVCEQANIEIIAAIKTSIDFGERLKNGVPQGRLTISIGDLNAELPVFIDDTRVGVVSQGKPLNLNVSSGQHTVKVCSGDVCEKEDVEIKSLIQTSLNFREQFKNVVLSGPLSVSIGSFDRELPVFIDNTSVGVASQSKPLNLMVREGRHTVKVCVGDVCEKEDVEIKFAKQTSVNFGERLIKDFEFSKLTVRIVKSSVTGDTLLVGVEYINPENIDHTVYLTLSCVYSYSSGNARQNAVATAWAGEIIKAGTRRTVYYTADVFGSNVIATEPVIIDMKIK